MWTPPQRVGGQRVNGSKAIVGPLSIDTANRCFERSWKIAEMTLSELASHIEGSWIEGPDVEVQGVRHDSRSVEPGDLFVCLGGDNFDGHQFAGDAASRGAAAL